MAREPPLSANSSSDCPTSGPATPKLQPGSAREQLLPSAATGSPSRSTRTRPAPPAPAPLAAPPCAEIAPAPPVPSATLCAEIQIDPPEPLPAPALGETCPSAWMRPCCGPASEASESDCAKITIAPPPAPLCPLADAVQPPPDPGKSLPKRGSPYVVPGDEPVPLVPWLAPPW